MNGQKESDSSSEGTPDSKKIRRPPNAFMVFAKDYRKSVAKENPNTNNKEISKILGNIWRDASQAVKNKYHNKAGELLALHKAKYPDYVYCPRDARKKKEERVKLKAIKESVKRSRAKSNDGSFELQKGTGAGLSFLDTKEGWKTELTGTAKSSSPGYVPNNPEFFPECSGPSSSDDIPLTPIVQKPASWETGASPSLKKTDFSAEAGHQPFSGGSTQQPSSWEPREPLSQENARSGFSSEADNPLYSRGYGYYDPCSFSNAEFWRRFPTPFSPGATEEGLPARFPYLPYPFLSPLCSASRPFPVGAPYPTSLLQKFGRFPPPFLGPRSIDPHQGFWGDKNHFPAFSPYGQPPDFFPQPFGFYQAPMVNRGFAFPSTTFGYAGDRDYPGRGSLEDRTGELGYPRRNSQENRVVEQDYPGRSSFGDQTSDLGYPGRSFQENQALEQDYFGKSSQENLSVERAQQGRTSLEDRPCDIVYSGRGFQEIPAGNQDYLGKQNIEDHAGDSKEASQTATSTLRSNSVAFDLETDPLQYKDLSLQQSSHPISLKTEDSFQSEAKTSSLNEAMARNQAWAKAVNAAHKIRDHALELPKRFVPMSSDGLPLEDCSYESLKLENPNQPSNSIKTETQIRSDPPKSGYLNQPGSNNKAETQSRSDSLKSGNINQPGSSIQHETQSRGELPKCEIRNRHRAKSLSESLKSRNLTLTVTRSDIQRGRKPLKSGNCSLSGNNLIESAASAAPGSFGSTAGTVFSRMALPELGQPQGQQIPLADPEASARQSSTATPRFDISKCTLSSVLRGTYMQDWRLHQQQAVSVEGPGSAFGAPSYTQVATPGLEVAGSELPPPGKKLCTGEGMGEAGPGTAPPLPSFKGAFHTTGPISTATIYGSKMEYNRNLGIVRKSPVPPHAPSTSCPVPKP